MLEKIKNSLATKCLFIGCLCYILVLSAITAMNVFYQSRALSDMASSQMREMARLAWMSTSHLMFMGDQEGVSEQFVEYKNSLKNLDLIYLTDSKGIIRRSSEKKLEGLPSISPHINSALKGIEFHGLEFNERMGKIIYTEILPVKNQKECYSCMGSKDEILGVVRVALDWSPATRALNFIRNNNILLSLVCLIVLSSLLLFFVFRLIVRPIKKLEIGVKKAAEGDLDTEVLTNSQDEIGALTNSFNKMVRDLKRLTGEEEYGKQLAVLNANLQKEIIERQSAEIKLQAAYEQLKQAQLQLFQSSKMASIGTLAGGVAHEINNPLTGVLNNVQLIKMIAQGKETFNLDDFRELLDVVEDSANRCIRITRALLDFSHASKGEYVSLAINEVVEKVLFFVGHDLALENIKIEKDLGLGLPFIKGDSQLLQQVIMDLLSNARWAIKEKYGKEGGIITVRSRTNSGENGVSLIISDNGIGIPPENQVKVFEPFFTTKKVGEGTGLGLAVVYNIIRSHHGKITIQSEPGQGAEFKIFLPAG